MRYEHVQMGRLHWILLGIVMGLLAAGWAAKSVPPVATTMFLAALICSPFPFMFATLTVRDEGETLSIRFGPILGFSKRIRYADITAVEAARSWWIDGWGIHYMPGRGWIYNLWGFDCVKIMIGSKTLRIGTDDQENLVRFLQHRIASPANNASR